MKKRVFLLCMVVAGCASLTPTAFAQGATFSFEPATGTISQKETFWIAVMVHANTEQVGEVAASFSYPQDLLEPAGIDTSGSILRLFSEQSGGGGMAAKGKVFIAGKPLPPGFSGTHKIASVGFRAKKSSGKALLSFLPDSKIVRSADGQNIVTRSLLKEGTYALQLSSPQPVPPPPPLSEQAPLLISNVAIQEIANNEFVISWETNRKADTRLEYGVTAESAAFVSHAALTTSHQVYVPKTILSDAYYFRIRSADTQGFQADTGEMRAADFVQSIAQSSLDEKREGQEKSGKSSFFSLGIFLFAILFLIIIIFFLIYKIRSRMESW